ncbi:MAG: HAMP domain-containing protein [Proteobacteria bacterium]|nr:HAMP domain-containing protein [Pseudomonadota bacterium]
MSNPIARKLYVRIWLAVAGSVLLLSLVLAWAWHQAERERDRLRPLPREVVVRNDAGERIGTAVALLRRGPGRGTGFAVTLDDGEVLNLELASPRPSVDGEPVGPPRWRLLAWFRPPYGFIWMVTLAGLAVMVGVFPIARRLTQRLEALQRGVQRWGEGRLDERVPVAGADEVADLARHFNASAARIEELMHNQAALLQSQKSLLANASHELRSPLARIRMAVELMPPRSAAAPAALPPEGALATLGRPGGGSEMPPHSAAAPAALPPEGALAALGRPGGGSEMPPRSAAAPAALPPESEARAEIQRNIAELDQLIDEILLASRLDAPQSELGTMEVLDLVGLVAEEAARIDADLTLAPGLPQVQVRGVSKLLRRAVRNLLENAARHGRRAGQPLAVGVALSVQGGQAVLQVDDRGPGVPVDLRERIFEPFYRLPGASEREGGVGLGLALVRSIAQRHGGSVACGEHPGGGARFSLRLPLAP